MLGSFRKLASRESSYKPIIGSGLIGCSASMALFALATAVAPATLKFDDYNPIVYGTLTVGYTFATSLTLAAGIDFSINYSCGLSPERQRILTFTNIFSCIAGALLAYAALSQHLPRSHPLLSQSKTAPAGGAPNDKAKKLCP